jgi:ribosomal protein S27E
MSKTLKETLKYPFIPSKHGVVLNNERDVFLVTSESKIERECKNISIFIVDALNEKYERDFNEPLQWWKRDGFWKCRCPKCKNDSIEFFNYCPNCGQRLLQPKN